MPTLTAARYGRMDGQRAAVTATNGVTVTGRAWTRGTGRGITVVTDTSAPVQIGPHEVERVIRLGGR